MREKEPNYNFGIDGILWTRIDKQMFQISHEIRIKMVK